MGELVRRAGRGDREAFGELVERFQDAVYGTAYALVGDFHHAHDLAQESFIRAWSKLATLRDPDRFPGWLYRITRNCCLDFLRRRKPGTVSLSRVDVPASELPTAPEKLQKAEMREAVLDAVGELSEPHRLATTLFYIDGYSVREVAKFLEVPSGTVKRRLHDSRKQLKERMLAMVEDELKGSRPGPEFRDDVMREISRVEVRPERSPSDQGRVLLVDKDDRHLPIIIGKTEEAAIHRAVSGRTPPRPLTHELFLAALDAFGISVKEARVTQLQDGIFSGELVLEHQGGQRILDSRPSDAVALAMMTGAKVTVAEEVMREGGAKTVRTDAELEKLWKSLAGPEEFNQELIELCSALRSLADDALVQTVHETGAEAVATALSAVREKVIEEEGGTKKLAIGILATIHPEAREGLPEEIVRAVTPVFERLEQVGVEVDPSCVPRMPSREAMVAAREALRKALRKEP
ncbi:MAG: DUF151 domain-containing protein [Candidatus Brocadiaceae bacterium]